MRLYTTLSNINEICIHKDNNKHFCKIEKTPQTNIAVNGLYDTKLCGSNTVQCHPTDHPSQCWSEVFFIYLNFCYYR